MQDAFDAGAYNTVSVHLRLLKPDSGGNIRLQHAAVNEDDAYVDINGATWSLSAGPGGTFYVSDFLRFIRWVCDGAVAGDPIVTLACVST